jgi:hypothetical protein
MNWVFFFPSYFMLNSYSSKRPNSLNCHFSFTKFARIESPTQIKSKAGNNCIVENFDGNSVFPEFELVYRKMSYFLSNLIILLNFKYFTQQFAIPSGKTFNFGIWLED